MTPADQRFGADQAAIRQMQLRLIEQFEFVALGGERQFGFQRQARFRARAGWHPRTARDRRAWSALARLNARWLLLSSSSAVRPPTGNTAAPIVTLTRCWRVPPSSGASKAAPIRSAKRTHAFAEIVDRRARWRIRRRSAAPRVPAPAIVAAQALRHRTQHEVAAGVAEHVVDLLKAVEADAPAAPPRRHRSRPWQSSRPVSACSVLRLVSPVRESYSARYLMRSASRLRTEMSRRIAPNCDAVGALPAGEAGLDRKHLAVACGVRRIRSRCRRPASVGARGSKTREAAIASSRAQIVSKGRPIISSGW